MVLLGIDIETFFIKASVLDAGTGQVITSAKYPEKEAAIITDGSTGALLVPVYLNVRKMSFVNLKPLQIIYPSKTTLYETLYAEWKKELEKRIN